MVKQKQNKQNKERQNMSEDTKPVVLPNEIVVTRKDSEGNEVQATFHQHKVAKGRSVGSIFFYPKEDFNELESIVNFYGVDKPLQLLQKLLKKLSQLWTKDSSKTGEFDIDLFISKAANLVTATDSVKALKEQILALVAEIAKTKDTQKRIELMLKLDPLQEALADAQKSGDQAASENEEEEEEEEEAGA